jgi:anaphase-promoting complex subunit 10
MMVDREFLKAYFVQLAILANHQNGRDTHVRQVKIYGPRQGPMSALGHDMGFTTPGCFQYACIR